MICGGVAVRRRQVLCDLKQANITLQAGAMQWSVGNVNATTGVKGVGDLFGKALRGKVTGESAIKPEYTGDGLLVLEPTYKHILLLDLADWNGSIVLDDGLFLACDARLKHKAVMRSNLSSAVAGNEGLFNLGIKCQPRQGLDNLRAEMLADITMQTLSGSSSPLYQEMLQSGLVNDSFSSEVFNGDGFFTMIFGGESRDPQAVREKVTAAILDAQKNGLDEVMFNESKKSAYGELVRKLGNVSAVTNTLVAAHMAGCGLYDPMQVLSEMTLDDCNRFLREEVDVRRMSLSVITPAE